jgi:hypothetical protein
MEEFRCKPVEPFIGVCNSAHASRTICRRSAATCRSALVNLDRSLRIATWRSIENDPTQNMQDTELDVRPNVSLVIFHPMKLQISSYRG